jgi:hypothetical protein
MSLIQNNNNINNNPSIVEIKSLEKELELMLAQYKNVHQQSMTNLPPTQSTLQLLTDTNNKILTLLSTIKSKTDILYPKGITNQHAVTFNNKHLIDITNKLHADQSELQRSIHSHNSLDGENNSLTLQLNSNYIQYIFYLIIAIVIAVYSFKLFGESDIVDMIILILAILLVVYHFMGSFIKYGKSGLHTIIRRFMSLVNIF